MIQGVVNANLEATIPLAVQDANGHFHDVEAVIDTGFSGSLTLPPGLIAALGIPWLCRQQGLLADGNLHVFDVYMATIIWDGQARVVEVEAVDAQPLVGMTLLQGYELKVQVAVGGQVIIDRLP